MQKLLHINISARLTPPASFPQVLKTCTEICRRVLTGLNADQLRRYAIDVNVLLASDFFAKASSPLLSGCSSHMNFYFS